MYAHIVYTSGDLIMHRTFLWNIFLVLVKNCVHYNIRFMNVIFIHEKEKKGKTIFMVDAARRKFIINERIMFFRCIFFVVVCIARIIFRS